MYKTQLGYLHLLTQLVFTLIGNNKGILTPDIIKECENDSKNVFKVLTVLVTAKSIVRYQNGWMLNQNTEEWITT